MENCQGDKMNKFEIACFVCGLILSFLGGASYEGNDRAVSRLVVVHNIICHIICGLMVVLPLYFNFWRH